MSIIVLDRLTLYTKIQASKLHASITTCNIRYQLKKSDLVPNVHLTELLVQAQSSTQHTTNNIYE